MQLIGWDRPDVSTKRNTVDDGKQARHVLLFRRRMSESSSLHSPPLEEAVNHGACNGDKKQACFLKLEP
jgi:hypothetical protein